MPDGELGMVIHREPATLSVKVLEEYLTTAELCLKQQKSDGGCLGYSAILLLFCVVDALGGYLALAGRSDLTKGEPFLVLNEPCFGLSLTKGQAKQLEWWYRNGLAHNAALPPGTCLSGEEGEPFDFAAQGDPVNVRVFPSGQTGMRSIRQAPDRANEGIASVKAPYGWIRGNRVNRSSDCVIRLSAATAKESRDVAKDNLPETTTILDGLRYADQAQDRHDRAKGDSESPECKER